MFYKMVHLKLFLFVVLFQAASAKIASRQGFVVRNKEWQEVIGNNEEDAKEFIRGEFLITEIQFLTVPEDSFRSTPPVLHLNKVLLGVSSSGVVTHPAKYFGYVPDFAFAENLIAKHYLEVVESVKTHLPSCKIVVVRDEEETLYTCCQQEYEDHIRLDVDEVGLLLHLPTFDPYNLE